MNSDLIDIEAVLRHETDGAFLLDHEGDNPVWVPKSLVQDNGDGAFAMPEWLALEKGLI